MKLSEAKEAFYEFSNQTSSTLRQLGFAGIAIIWIFCRVVGESLSVPEPLILPAIFIMASLAFDVLHYLSATLVWWIYYSYKSKTGTEEQSEINPPSIINFPHSLFFILKIGSMAIAFYFILNFLISNLNKNMG